MVGGAGARFCMADGRAILDMSSLAECSNLGHQHPRVVAAIRARPSSFASSPRPGARPRPRSPQRLLELSGFDGGRVFFTLGGADANETCGQASRAGHGQAATA